MLRNKKEQKIKEIGNLWRRYSKLDGLIMESEVFTLYTEKKRFGWILKNKLIKADRNPKEDEMLQFIIDNYGEEFFVQIKNKPNANRKPLRIRNFWNFMVNTDHKKMDVMSYPLWFISITPKELEKIEKIFPGISKYFKENFKKDCNSNLYLTYEVNIPKEILKKTFVRYYIHGEYNYDTDLISERDILNNKLFKNNVALLRKNKSYKNYGKVYHKKGMIKKEQKIKQENLNEVEF